MDAAWSYEQSPEGLPLAGLVAFAFDKLDGWLEEDDPVRGHPRDRYHRFDCHHTSEVIVVRVITPAAHGDDGWTRSVERRLSEIFEREVAVFLVPTGTAANALALAHVVAKRVYFRPERGNNGRLLASSHAESS